MDIVSMFVEIREMGFRQNFYYHKGDSNEVTYVAYQPKGGRVVNKVIYRGPDTALPNLVFMALRDIRKIKRAERDNAGHA